MNETGVMLTKKVTIAGKNESYDDFWNFDTDGSIFTVSRSLEVTERLEYENTTANCSVVRVEEWYFSSEEKKARYDKLCTEGNVPWCNCSTRADEKQPYLCIDTPNYELRVDETHRENVSEDCKTIYDKKRKQYKAQDYEVYTNQCKNYRDDSIVTKLLSL
nr:uncharacterized protein LOC129385516 [Dermacentor andersoni]